MHRLATTLAAVLTASVATLVGASASAAPAPTIDLAPASIARGADLADAHLVGDTIVDGDRTVSVPGRRPTLYGASGEGYVVLTGLDGSRSVVFVAPETAPRVLVDGVGYKSVRLGTDGTFVSLTSMNIKEKTSRVRAIEVATGDVVAARTFTGYANVLDSDADRVVLATAPPNKTMSWDVSTGDVTTIIRQAGYRADLSEGLLATTTGDPYLNGCSRLVEISAPRTTLWRSCEERVETFAPGGKRIATVHILSDGLGPNTVRSRTVSGRLLATYRVDGWFGYLGWESATDLLLETNGQRKSATVRCDVADCDRATDLQPTPDV
ncbi:MAG: hypothetical protein F2667_08725 [Actinobacteria bacterium]|uniref:Unannotated protein n=1 Tax=freshwater metagenome TaxID=449393 RepID=A0A6J6QWF8_9ZZZZ|nr:hypothetical protein [Actinomycetota bacterium]